MYSSVWSFMTNKDREAYSDEVFARMLQEQEKLEYVDDQELADQLQQQCVMDLIWDEETPDVHQLFLYFNQKYFDSKLDIVEHEMIHAFLFIIREEESANGEPVKSDGHGPRFLEEAKRINDATGFNISIYHSFHDELYYYLPHVWQCNGICNTEPPYFGSARHSTDRPPGPADNWYKNHQLTCGGTYKKVASPTNKRKVQSTNILYQDITAPKKMKL
ncbi:hypothetical protein MFLAVUS_003905 [Mucor flavus]|uniref:SprT-like domain-containing protein n=1 Tax=Mucor flavus TaxID=439312 RepID=A0ABP9YUF4_9FUNG